MSTFVLDNPVAQSVWLQWRAGSDTRQIAKKLGKPEHEIYRILFRILDARYRDEQLRSGHRAAQAPRPNIRRVMHVPATERHQ